MKTKAQSTEGRFAYQGLDRVIHERARLSVLTSLISSPKGVTFGELKQLCSLTGAGTGCGSCRPEVQRILEETLANVTSSLLVK